MINRIRRAKQVLHEEGFLALSKQFLLFLRHLLFLYSSHNIYESTLDPPDITCEVDGLTVRMITSLEELDRLESEQSLDEGFDIPRDKEILSMGAMLFCAFGGKELAHITQVFIGRMAHEIYPFSFAMPYGHTVAMAAFTTPKYRRKGINAYTHSKVLRYLKEKGVSRAWDIQDKDNIAARDSLLKIDYYLWGEACRLRLLSLFTIEWTRPKSQALHRQTRCTLNLKLHKLLE